MALLPTNGYKTKTQEKQECRILLANHSPDVRLRSLVKEICKQTTTFQPAPQPKPCQGVSTWARAMHTTGLQAGCLTLAVSCLLLQMLLRDLSSHKHGHSCWSTFPALPTPHQKQRQTHPCSVFRLFQGLSRSQGAPASKPPGSSEFNPSLGW